MSVEESKDKPYIPTHTQRSESVDKDKQHKEIQRRLKSIRMDFAICFGTPEGKRVLKWIFTQSGFGQSQIGGNPQLGMDVLQGTLYNNARESLYIEMRKLTPHEILKQVEFENIEDELL